jgi:hypothetical protein
MAKTPRYVESESENVGVSSLFLRPNGAASSSLPFIGIARSRSSGVVVVSGGDGATFADLKLIASFNDL